MKKISVACAVVVMLVVAFAGCGKSGDKVHLTDNEKIALETEVLRAVYNVAPFDLARAEVKEGKMIVTFKGSRQAQVTLGTHLKLLTPAEYEVDLAYPESGKGTQSTIPPSSIQVEQMGFRWLTEKVTIEVNDSFDLKRRILAAGTTLRREGNGVWVEVTPR